MNWQDLREGWFRIAGLWRRRRRERELAEELEFHFAMKISAGQSVEQARREFGGFEKWKEVCRDVERWRFVEELGRDLVLALRMLHKSRVFTAVALVTLTLAIGANTAIFSLMNELVLKSLPVPNAGRLATLRMQPDDFGFNFSYPVFQAIQQRSDAVMQTFAYADRSFDLRVNDGIEVVAGQFVSGQYFAALGMRPQLGRWIEPFDDRSGGPDGMVAVVSDHFWQNHMSASRRALGQKIIVNRAAFTVVGVMPKEFRGMSRDRAPEIFLPLQLEPLVDSPFNLISAGLHAWWFSVGGLRKDGVSLEQVNAFFRTSSRQILETAGLNSGFNRHKMKDLHLIADPGANGVSHLRLRFRHPLTVLMGLVTMVLLVACLNLATLLTARAASRAREMSTRFALGASRARLLRQLLTESLLLALVGAGLGLAASPGLARIVAVMLIPQRGPDSPALEVAPDLVVFAFTAFLAVLATVVIGILPAVRSTSGEFQAFIREGSNSIRGAERRHWWPRLLLAIEVALSLVLITGASLLGYSLVKLHRTPMGFDPHGLVYLVPEGKQPIVGQRLLSAYKEAVDEIRQLSTVEDASISAAVPIDGTYIDEDVQAVGGSKHHFQENSVGPDYFKTLRMPLLSGREFRWTDADASERKVILNRSAARLLFPNGKILGRHVIFGDGKTQAEVVGVVADSKYSNIRDVAPPTVYSAVMQSLIPGASPEIMIRAKGPVTPLIVAARKIVKRAIPDVSAPAALSLEETIAESLATERIMSILALFFAGVALLTTGIGLYGTVAYSTERRTGEIGIRLALGAQFGDVVSMVCAENGSIALFGCFGGIVGSLSASRVIANLLYGVSARDPVVLGATTLMLLCVAATASLVPAIRAAKIDPVAAIRYQ